jgi:hypothetical protein
MFTSALFCHGSTVRKVVHCKLGGSGQGSLAGGREPPSKLIIPGSSPGGGGNAPRLIVPDSPTSTSGPRGMEAAGSDPSAQPQVRNFRPPPGFMDAEGPAQTEVDVSPQDMLRRLQAQAGQWHQLAKLFPALLAKGYDAGAVEEATGLEKRTQNIWISAASIYEALKKSGKVPAPTLAFFDAPGGESLLHELRFLSLRQRIAAVCYVVDNNLSPPEAQVLARAMKEHERRLGERDGFADSPGDCLAYKFFRDALECRRQEDAQACAAKGLAVVETDQGRAKLESMMGISTATESADRARVTLEVLRLTDEEVGWRPVPLLGNVGDVTAAALSAAPKASSRGVFGVFSLPEEGAEFSWVPLPAWSMLMVAPRPVALAVPNCAEFVPLKMMLNLQAEDDTSKVGGEGILVVDIDAPIEVKAEGFYAVKGENEIVDIVHGSAMHDECSVLGSVLFLARPPRRDSAAANTSELLSV